MGDDAERGNQAKPQPRFLGSLRDALAAAGRDDQTKAKVAATRATAAETAAMAAPPVAPHGPTAQLPPPLPAKQGDTHTMAARPDVPVPSAAEAAREARGGTPNVPPADRHVEHERAPTTGVMRNAKGGVPPAPSGGAARTQLVRGKQKVSRQQFHQDPVVGWLVIVGGPGLGAYRPIFEGNNTIGRSANQRVPLDFGDDAISSEEQSYVRYDSSERTFLFVPNMAKTNVVAINDKRPTTAVTLQAMDVITMGRTQLVFVPFCGAEFDWSVISDAQS